MQVSAKKKNNDDDLAFAEEYPLPELPQNITPAKATTVAGTSVASQSTTTAVENNAPQPIRQQPTAAQGSPSQPLQSIRPVATATSAGVSAESTAGSSPSQQATYIPPRRSALAGLSLSELLNSTTTHVEQAEEQKKSAEEVYIDPQSEWKLNNHRKEVVESILQERPRFVVAFESMQIEGHVIKLEVPSHTLYEEIMRSKTEILMQMARTAGVEGMLDMQIVVNEQIKASRPIKLEDRIHFMTEKNPLLLELKKALEMEYE